MVMLESGVRSHRELRLDVLMMMIDSGDLREHPLCLVVTSTTHCDNGFRWCGWCSGCLLALR